MSKSMADRQEREYEDMAVQAIMVVRAMNEKNVDVDTLTGKKGRKRSNKQSPKQDESIQSNPNNRRTVTKSEKQSELMSLGNSLGKAVR